ncbi:E3 ubiquitin-protein ligase RNF181-like [Watersipora subatra]|uniref:E3 ubiquitin-protein ligase RNF181-like n=1 Tax=Watersipora subatra TaxID=2589382 RepID=UPI00355C9976
MASYFDEHNCEPLGHGQSPDHLLHLARMLQEGGYMEEFQELFGQIQSSPPASQEVVKQLPELEVNESDINEEFMCAVCRAEYTTEDKPKLLPCSHKFHSSCIIPWLKKTNTCPECRFELPTDDEAYEAMKKHKSRENQRKYELESLHDSMFG